MAKTYGNFTDFIDFSRASGGTALRKVSYGAELVTNGTFDSDTSGWSIGGTSSLSVVSQKLRVTNDATAFGYASQAVSTLVGKIYTFEVEITSPSGNALVYIGTSFGGSQLHSSGNIGSGSYRVNFVATSSTTYIRVGNGSSTLAVYNDFDNISVKEVTFDQPDGTLELFNHPAGIPRIEYDANGNEIGLLIEEQRTNLVSYSNSLDTIAQIGLTSATQNVTGPDGGLSLFAIVEDTGTSNHYVAANITVTASVDNCFSCIVSDAGDGRYIYFRSNNDGANQWINVDPTTGSITEVGSAVSDSGIINLGGGFYRPWFVCQSADGSSGYIIAVSNTATPSATIPSYLGDGSSKINAGYVQIEQGSFPTSYIPTSGATATRSADIADIATANFGYNQKAGTVVVDFNLINTPFTNFARVFEFGNSGGSSSIGLIGTKNTNNLYGSINFSGAEQLSYNDVFKAVSEGTSKAAVSYTENDYAINIDGSQLAGDTSVLIPTGLATLHLGKDRSGTGNQINGHIKSIKYIPRRNTNNQLQEFTS